MFRSRDEAAAKALISLPFRSNRLPDLSACSKIWVEFFRSFFFFFFCVMRGCAIGICMILVCEFCFEWSEPVSLGAGSSTLVPLTVFIVIASQAISIMAIRWSLHHGLVLLSFLKTIYIVFLGLPKRENFIVCLSVPRPSHPARRSSWARRLYRQSIIQLPNLVA